MCYNITRTLFQVYLLCLSHYTAEQQRPTSNITNVCYETSYEVFLICNEEHETMVYEEELLGDDPYDETNYDYDDDDYPDKPSAITYYIREGGEVKIEISDWWRG